MTSTVEHPYVSIDTEYNRYLPFIATSTNEKLENRLYDLKVSADRDNLRKICSSKQTSKVFHAIANDLFALHNVGIKVVPPYECTMIAASLLNENFETRKLKRLAEKYLGELCLEEKLLSKVKAKYKREAKKAGKKFSYADIPAEILYPYAKKDTEYTLKLWYLFKGPLKKYAKLYSIEKSLIPIVFEMVKRGVMLDRKFLKKMCHEYEMGEMKVRRKMNKVVGSRKVNYGSPKQMHYLFEKLNINIKLTSPKTGLMKTDAQTLRDYIKENNITDKNHFVHLLLYHRFYRKHRGTYYYPLYRGDYSVFDKNIAHFMFYQSGAKTGRFTAELIQTIPREEDDDNIKELNRVREAFIARPGYTLLSIDYDQIEMRLFAHFSNCLLLIKDILRGIDPHLGTAITLFGKNILKKSKKKIKKFRKIAKNIQFGIIFGMGKNKLARSLGLPLIKANDILAKYYRRYPVKEFMKSIISELYRRGHLHVSFDSNFMKFSRDYRVPQDKAYKAVNVLIQGTAAYVIKLAMIRVSDYIKKNKLDIHLLMQIHDELVFEVNNKYDIKKIYKTLANLMNDMTTFKVPIVGSGKFGKSYGNLEEVA